MIWARDEDGRGDVGGFILDRTDDDSTGDQASAIRGKMSNRALHQADILIEEMHVPLENRLEQPRPFGEGTDTFVADDSLAARVRAGDKRALARAISLVEDDDPAGWELMGVLYPLTGRTAVIGFTGSPGGGKSTLISALVTRLRARHRKVGVVSIDPSSPFRGGALLGDRIRLSEHFLDPGVFIRSMATRGALGGLAEAALQTAQLMDAAGFDDVLLETVGVGQAEVDIVAHADTVVLVLIPGSGDSVQAMKAGVMEIPDVIVVNKSDHPLADTMVRQVRTALSLSPREGRRVPIVKTEAIRGEGIDDLLDALRQHRSRIAAEGTLEERRRRNLMNEVLALAGARMQAALAAAAADDPWVQGLLDAVVARRIDPANAARQMLAGDVGRQAAPLLERTLTADLED